MNEDFSCKCCGHSDSCQCGTKSDRLSESNHGNHSPASNVTYVNGQQSKDDNCGHSLLQGDQSVTKTKCESVSSQLKTKDKDRGAVSSVVTEVCLNPSQPEEVQLYSDDKDNHMAAEEPEQPQETDNDGKHFCQICGKEFRTQNHQCRLTRKLHVGVRPHKCIYCQKRFASRNHLIVHLRTHAKEKPFFCPVCGMNFSLRVHVESHMKTHSKKTAATTNVQEERDAVGGLINSGGEELELDPGSSKVIPNMHQTDDQPLDKSVDQSCCCHVCGNKFSNSRALQRHQRSHTGTKPYKCSQCGTAFNFLNKLKRHLLIHTNEKPFSCPVCDKRFSQNDGLKGHLSVHGWSAGAEETAEASGGVETTQIGSDTSQNSCCKPPDAALPDDTATPTEPEHNRSLKTTYWKRRKITEAEELFSCTECNKDFQSVYTRDRHLREKHGKHTLHKCYDCGQTFKVNRSLIVHRRIYHPAPGAAVEPEEERRAPKTYVCSTCGKQFPTSASLNRHLIIHSGKKPYKCTLCGRGFTQIGNLKTHQKIHKGKFATMAALEKSQPEEAQSSVEICLCHLCWTQFSDKQLLEEHLKQVHESKKPFSCTQCGKRFTYIQKLKEHEAGHEGLKPYLCSQCDKGFQTSKGLENHMRDHTGEKPFPCVICGKRFKQESTLRAHYVTHSGERPHLCSICGKRYARAEELKVHLRVHTGEKPYQCEECGKSFYYRQGFNNHKKTHNAKPIGPTRQLGRPRQLGSTRKSKKAKNISQRALPDSDGEDLTWGPPDLGSRPLGDQESHAADNHSQTSQWSFGHHTVFNLWDLNPNASDWRAAEGHQAYGAPAGGGIDFNSLLRVTAHQEHFKEGEQPSWPPGTSSVSPPLELGLTTPLSENTTSEKMHLSKTSAEVNPHEEPRPEPQDQDQREAPTDDTARLPEPEHSSSHEHPQEKLPEEPKQDQGPHRPKKNYDCPTCGRMFSHNTALRRHLVIHSGKRPFKCFICGRGFTQSGNLKTHMKVHRGELPHWTLVQEKSPSKESPVTVHMCGECGMDFPQKQQLEEHRQSHKKPYACPDCGKTFKNEYYFKIHKRVHSGDSPFLCSECGKSCVTADSLKKHELTHTGEKNYRCDQCGKAFSQSSHLNVHIKTHTGERPHLCSICGKSYSKASDLKVHLRVHTGEKPYTCDKCGKCFYYSQGYRAHLKIHDKKPKPPTKPLGRPKQQLLVVKNQ